MLREGLAFFLFTLLPLFKHVLDVTSYSLNVMSDQHGIVRIAGIENTASNQAQVIVQLEPLTVYGDISS